MHPCSSVDDGIHADVVRFAGKGIKDLERKGKSDEGTGEVGEKAVVVASTASKPVALRRECYAWDDGKVDVSVMGEEGTRRFLYAV